MPLAQALVLSILLPPCATTAMEQEPLVTTVPHVRGADRCAVEALDAAANLSPTVAGLVAELQASDLIVTIVCAPLQANVNGMARMLVAAGGVRHVRVALRVPNGRRALLEVLGHELQHCVELAGMPDVRDDATLAAAYRRLGAATARDGLFETEAAVRTGARVAREVAARRGTILAVAAPVGGGTGAGVRALQPRGARLLGQATRCCPSVQALIEELRRSDLVVHLDLAWSDPGPLNGWLRFRGAAGGFRYLHVWLEPRHTDEALVPLLAHELQHAVEVSRVRGVRTERALAALYDAIGTPAGGGRFETDAARRAEALARREHEMK